MCKNAKHYLKDHNFYVYDKLCEEDFLFHFKIHVDFFKASVVDLILIFEIVL